MTDLGQVADYTDQHLDGLGQDILRQVADYTNQRLDGLGQDIECRADLETANKHILKLQLKNKVQKTQLKEQDRLLVSLDNDVSKQASTITAMENSISNLELSVTKNSALEARLTNLEALQAGNHS